MKDAGFEFRRILHTNNWTQSQMAEELAVSTAAINQWTKRGIPRGRTIDIARATGASLEECENAVYRPPAKQQAPKYDHAFLDYENSGEAFDLVRAALEDYRLKREDYLLLNSLIKRLGQKKV